MIYPIRQSGTGDNLIDQITETPAQSVDTWQLRLQQVRLIAQRMFPFAAGAVAAVLVIALHGLLTPEPTLLTARDVQNSIAEAMASATPRAAFSAQVYEIIRPSLVLIETDPMTGEGAVRYNPGVNNLHLVQDEDNDIGTGVIVNDTGDILTSLHVIAAASTIRVTFADGTVSPAQIVGTLSDDDIAVLRADLLPEEIIPATLGSPNAMRVGDEAYVVGHPFGLYGSMSAGVISGFERTFQPPDGLDPIDNLIQVDAATNPGASGGPLLNRYGQVVGIMTMLMNPTGQNVFVGVGFAVPITTAGGAAGLPPR
jgi:serine protease DegQ